jgi:hypothetical protein
LEVSALQSLLQFQFDKAQLEKLQQLSVGTAPKEQKRKAGKASKEFRDKLTALRKALAEAKDEARIVKLSDELDALREKEKPTLDDDVETTEAARKRAVEVFPLLKPTQLAFYFASVAEEVADPFDRLTEALEEVREMTEEEWKEQRGEIAEEIGRLAVGMDPVKSKAMIDQVAALLLQARTLKKVEFQKQQADLKKAARKIIGNPSALEVLRHQVEMDLAALLSNPRLPQALRARLSANSKSAAG